MKIFGLNIIKYSDYIGLESVISELEKEKSKYYFENINLQKEVLRLKDIEDKYNNLTDRDSKGRFVKKEIE